MCWLWSHIQSDQKSFMQWVHQDIQYSDVFLQWRCTYCKLNRESTPHTDIYSQNTRSCNLCCFYWSRMWQIWAGAVSLMEHASAIISSTQRYQAQASDAWLNKPSIACGVGGGLNKLKNLGKAQAVVAEWKAKRDKANLVGIGIKVGAMLWKILKQEKKTKVCILYFSHINHINLILCNFLASRLSPSKSFMSLAQKLRQKMYSGCCWVWSTNHLWIDILMLVCWCGK